MAVSGRRFIQSVLTAPKWGYFSAYDVLAAVPQLEFHKMLGAWEFHSQLAKAYNDSPTGWLTPASVFGKLWAAAYADALAIRWAGRGPTSARPGTGPPLVVYELGAGAGHTGAAFADRLRASWPALYKRLEYITVEVSPRLADTQRQTMAAAGHAKKHRVIQADAVDLHAVHNDDRPCTVLAFELLDNLPHDKFVQRGSIPEQCLDHAGAVTPVSASSMPIPASLQSCARAGEAAMHGEAAWRQCFAQPTAGSASAALSSGNDGNAAWAEVYAQGTDVLDPWAVAALGAVLQRGQCERAGASTGAGAGASSADPDILDQLPTQQLASSATDWLTTARNWLWPAQDPAAQDAWRAKAISNAQALWVPTGAMQLLASVHTALPQSSVLAVDFSWLPGRNMPRRSPSDVARVIAAHSKPTHAAVPESIAEGAPLVVSKHPGETEGSTAVTIEHEHWLSPTPLGCADIYFPVDWPALAGAAQGVWHGADVAVSPLATWLDQHAPRVVEHAKTLTGWNPMLHSYSNVRVLDIRASPRQ